MTSERRQQVEEVFHTVLARPVDERALFIREVCGDDPTLRQEVENLLRRREEADTFIQEPSAAEQFAAELMPASGSMAGRQVGAYRLIREIGAGGMGAVYLAVRSDNEFRQRVAVKLLKRGMDTDFIIRRFRNERQILAAFDHPNIARLLDGGTTDDGLPYFVMEYIEGLPINRYCDAQRLTVAERLQLFQQVCSAVQYAHERQVIHRDIKPGNILVAEDGATRQPKLLDFGIAKILDPDLAADTLAPTLPAMRMMTPEYASPEQALGDAVTAATDQYSLGVLLYELLTGRRPHWLSSRAPREIARVIGREEPERPSVVVARTSDASMNDGQRIVLTPAAVSRDRNCSPDELQRALAGAIDDIVMQTLHKEPTARYASVRELAADINRFLQNQPVAARNYEQPAHAAMAQAPPASAANAATVANAATAIGAAAPTQIDVVVISRTGLRRALLVAALLLVLIGGAVFFQLKKSRSQPVAPPSAAKSVAVLPFKIAGSGEAERALGLGMADEVTARLGRFSQFAARPLSAVRPYLTREIEPQQAGRELGVDYVLSGTLTHAAPNTGGLIIQARLLGVKDGATLWTMNFEALPAALPQAQDAIVAQLLSGFSAAAPQPTLPAQPINSAAYEAYLVGRYHLGQRSAQGVKTAIEQFERALTYDDRFAPAHAGLADCYLLLPSYQPLSSAAYAQAKEHALQALALDEQLAEAHTSLAQVRFHYDRDRAGAEASFRRAIALKPGYALAHHWFGVTLSAQGRHDEAVAEINAARQLDPYSAIILNDLGVVFYFARRYDEALAAARQALALNPGLALAHQLSSWIYQATGRYEDALGAARQEQNFAGASAAQWPILLAQVQAGTGRYDEARATLAPLDAERVVKLNPRKLAYGLAAAYAQLGNHERALHWLARADAAKAFIFNFAPLDPRLAGLRADPRLAQLLRQAGLPN